jgi:hypothetical protein
MPAKDIRALTGYHIWDRYYKFCVIRNPFDKMVSLWWFIKSRQDYRYEHEPFSQVKSEFSGWCIGHAMESIDRDKYLIDGKVAVNCFIRYERLHEGLEDVCRQVGYPFQPERLGRFKSDCRMIKRPFCDYYDQKAIAAVETAFDWELNFFGYRWPSDR